MHHKPSLLTFTMILFLFIINACNNAEQKDRNKTAVADTTNVPPQQNDTTRGTDTQTDSNRAVATLVNLLPGFHINDENKDWNTKVFVKLIYQGRDIAVFDGIDGGCCSSGRGNCTNDDWCDGHDIPSPTHTLPKMIIKEAITKAQIDDGEYYIAFQATGNDKVKFNAKVVARFSDGTEKQWSWQGQDLDSRQSRVASRNYPLK